ncbi:phosphoglycan beta 13 galactosyltransferase (SCGR6) [Leptomonas pyrrhocoris]|uniref:Phosphoglycan beta 13 galactosyltransferase (SCGR6) n=1 Tax=Leptomonas pyrrhocoris TaxID=157538 RepID=A0A0N0DRM5_LEPPY|nr:phosphoglycan beta 13 galactosyltransferase (SCGR6) [Leptomonas pyrrhocoris]KPA74862.1 phosphoglycan beta 13 galactosyltransferase (SCGR6) [Leptomonas pyrrhocoris]|eukprot:XP_015653301.1 phosphoglycan beta 13 galactosyltransferase (SCGR6) [Leptomonas pyrrhocoris]
MLLAMSSVTDDVGVEQELPRWAWVESSFPAAAVGAAARFRSPTHHRDGHHRSHRRLAVLGIPSTDQPARLALREAQRATWLTYTGVARASNHFDGAVLPLYIFAASDDASRPSSSAAFFPRPPPSPAPPLPAAGDAQGPPAGARELVHPIAEHRQPGSNDTNNPHRNRGSNRHTDADAVDAEGAAKPTPMTAALLPTETELRCASRFYRIGGDATLAPPPASQSPPQQPQQPQRKPLSYPRRVFELTSGARRTILVRSSNQDVAAACGARRQVEPKVPPTSVDTTAVLNIEGNSKDDARLHDGVCGGVRQILVSGLTSPAIPTAATHPSVKGTPPAPHHFSPLASLGQQLRLPVTPAFVAPAEFVCYASASLWQEALEHRNVLWIDMMTDRRPTTNKTLGGTGDWGLPTEIGMTQKSVLWFYYAYHAFPDVPYIMKGDDDTYLKVPQFMSDWHMLRTGHREPALEARASPPFHTSPSRSFIVNTLANLTRTPLGGAVTYGIAEPSLEEEECLYWGATRVFLDRIAFNPGPLYALQRRLVQTALETLPDRDPNRDVLRLAAEDYDPARLPWYAYNVMQNEDAAFGKLMKERGERARQVCPRRRWWTVREVSPRFHDVHRGKTETVTWATMAVHRCTPADYYFLHYYFATEYLAALRSPTDTTPENAQEVEAARWAKAHLRGRVRGWDSLPNVSWCYNPSTDPSFIVSDEDGVALYDIPYEAWDEARTSVVTGGTSRLRMGKGFFASLFSMLT